MASSKVAGRWKERGLANKYLETNTVNCSLCGKIIPLRAWVAEQSGNEQIFCGPNCQRLHREYWMPKHGGRR